MRFHKNHISFLAVVFCLGSLWAQTSTTAEKSSETTVPPIKKRPSLVEMSTLLASGGNWVMIPKTALIYVPDRYSDKVVAKPSGSLISWNEFLKRNAGWIHTHEVTVLQARGKEVIDQKIIQAYQSMGKVVIATHQKNPITVKASSLLPPEEK